MNDNTTTEGNNDFNIVLPSGPPLATVPDQANTFQPGPLASVHLTPYQLQLLTSNGQTIQTQPMGTGAMETEANSGLATPIDQSGLGNQAGALGVSLQNIQHLNAQDQQLALAVLSLCKNVPNLQGSPITEKPGEKAKAEQACDLAKKYNTIQSDVNRLVQCKVMKAKLVNKTFQPLNTRSISNFMNVHRIPTWKSDYIQEKVSAWAIRGAEMIRQGLLMAIECEMVKLNGRRELFKNDANKPNPDFAMIQEVRRSLNM